MIAKFLSLFALFSCAFGDSHASGDSHYPAISKDIAALGGFYANLMVHVQNGEASKIKAICTENEETTRLCKNPKMDFLAFSDSLTKLRNVAGNDIFQYLISGRKDPKKEKLLRQFKLTFESRKKSSEIFHHQVGYMLQHLTEMSNGDLLDNAAVVSTADFVETQQGINDNAASQGNPDNSDDPDQIQDPTISAVVAENQCSIASGRKTANAIMVSLVATLALSVGVALAFSGFMLALAAVSVGAAGIYGMVIAACGAWVFDRVTCSRCLPSLGRKSANLFDSAFNNMEYGGKILIAGILPGIWLLEFAINSLETMKLQAINFSVDLD